MDLTPDFAAFERAWAEGRNQLVTIRLAADLDTPVSLMLKLAEAARNAPLVSFQRSLVSQTSLIIAQYESSGRSHCSYDEHNQLIDAIEARDAERAVHLMMHHMDHIDSKLNLDEESASDDLHAVFSHLLQTKKKPGRSAANR